MPADPTSIAISTAASEPGVDAAASTGMAASIGSTALALCFVLALAWLVLRGIKRLQAGKATAVDNDVPRVLRSVSLGPRERLVTVRYRQREYLLGVSAGGVSVIDVAASPEVEQAG